MDFFDVQAIAENVTDLLHHPRERQRLGANAREFAVKNYDLETVCLPRQLAWVENLSTIRGVSEEKPVQFDSSPKPLPPIQACP